MAVEPTPHGSLGGISREKLRVAWIVEGTLRFYREHFISILMVFIVANLLTWSIQYYSAAQAESIFNKYEISLGDFVDKPEEIYTEALPLLADLIVLMILVTVAVFFITMLFQAMTIKYVWEHLMGAEITWLESLFNIIHQLPILIAATVIAGLIVVLGMFALVVPGLILAVMFIFVPQAVILENEGPISSLSRSNNLTSGNKWTIFFFFAFWFVVLLLFSMILAQLPYGLWANILQLAVGTLFSPVIPISMTLAYHRINSDPRISSIPSSV